MLERPRDKSGDRYEYFTCSVRRRKTTQCTRSAILAERAEAEIERTYQRNSLTQTQAEHVRKVLNDVFDQLEGSSEDERKVLTAQRDKLEAERLKLVQAHYADAIPLDLLKSEQDRIRVSLDQITSRLDNLTDTYAEARTGLDQLTELLVDLDDLYNKCDPAERRILNRALFTRITIDDEENATYTPEQTTASVLAHTTIDAPTEVTTETKLPRHQAGQVSIFSSYVELRGFEPLTFSLRILRPSSMPRLTGVPWVRRLQVLPCHAARGYSIWMGSRVICDYPIQLADERTGEMITVPCGATDPAMCEGCANLHAGDVRVIIHEGLDQISGPVTFITLTAPGGLGGRTHSRPTRQGKPRPCKCGRQHAADDPILGTRWTRRVSTTQRWLNGTPHLGDS